MKNKTNYYPKFIPWENTPYKPNMKNKTKEVKADWEIEFDKEFKKYYIDTVSGGEYIQLSNEPVLKSTVVPVYEIKDFIKKNFVAKGEVREMIEDIQATEIADHSLASLIEKLYKYKKSLE